MTLILIALLAYGALPHPAAGTYSFERDGETIVRMDTRSGSMERCTLGTTLVCEPVQVAAK